MRVTKMKDFSFWFTLVMLPWLPPLLSATPSAAVATSDVTGLPAQTEIRETYINCVNSTGLTVFTLSSGCDLARSKPLVLLLHGFPEISHTWSHFLPPLAASGYCVVAPDLRGAGRTTGWDTRPYPEVDLNEFSRTNMVRDLVALVYSLGYQSALSVIGHDFGAVIAAWAALIRPDIFLSSVHMSAPFSPPPLAPYTTGQPSNLDKLETALGNLEPPRKYYLLFNSKPDAANNWNTGGSLGLHHFLRGYFYVKSADWPKNHPHPLANNSAQQLAVIPHYYVMLKNETMSETVASLTAGYSTESSKEWFPDSLLNLYVDEFRRVGLQGQLNWYRVLTSPQLADREYAWLMYGRKIEGPVLFVAGTKDWGAYQNPGALESYSRRCKRYQGQIMIPGAGHRAQLEQPKALTKELAAFLRRLQR